MDKRLWEYAVIFVGQKDKGGKWTEEPEIIVEPRTVLAGSEQEATLRAAREIPPQWDDFLDKVQVVVRPF